MNKKKMSKKRLGVWKAWLVALSFCCGVGGVEVPPALGTETTTSVPEVVHSLDDKAHAFEKNGQYEAAISVWDDLIHRFGALQNPTIQQRVAVALYNKAVALYTLNHHEASISVCGDIIHRFATSKNPMLRQAVASALNNENTILSQISGSVQNVAGSTGNGQLVNSQTQNLPRYEGSVGTW
ncbi:MAG: tetratricopeptide repeat protein [Acetobacter sp.]|nr:tetratricopeptide repeat protein [Acetobacter sp.]